MKRLLKEDYPDYIRAFEKPRLYGLRVNTLKITPEEFERIAPFPIKKIPYINNGYYYDGDMYKPAKHPYYFAGLYYLQDPSAMTPASRLPIAPGDRVLDLCAAPGGKSTELAARLMTGKSYDNGPEDKRLYNDGRHGIIITNDISVKRAKALQKNIELFGVKNAIITTEYPQKLEQYFKGYFNKILIDAPCSGEGMFRKDPDMVKSWTPDSPAQYAAMQYDIVSHALPMLAPGGYLLYSTCTFSPVEDEGTVMKILSENPTLSLADIEWYDGFASGMPEAVEGGIADLKKCARIFPHRMEGEGHFLALFHKADIAGGQTEGKPYDGPGHEANGSRRRSDRKRDTAGRSNRSGRMNKDESGAWSEFASGFIWEPDPALIESHEGMLYGNTGDMPDVKGLRFIRKGLFLGECKKNRFEPSQALAMALRKDEYRNTLNMDADDERVIRYLKGESVRVQPDECGSDGYVLVCVDNYPLGWGKLTKTLLKNKYHPGWRLM